MLNRQNLQRSRNASHAPSGRGGPDRPLQRKKQSRRSQPRTEPPFQGQSKMYAPLITGFVTRAQTRYAFGAAPHSNVADCTGLRLTFRSLYTNVIGNATNVKVLTGTGATSTSALSNIGMLPSAVAAANVPGLVSFVVGIANVFGLYRMRKLCYEFITACPTSTAVLLAMGYNRTVAELPTTAGVNDVSVLQRNVEFPAWSVEPVLLEAVADKKMDDPDAPLYALSTSESDTAVYQGNLVMAANTAVATNYGQLFVTAVMDLYCPNNATIALLKREKLAREEKRTHLALADPACCREELKAESSDSELVEMVPARAIRTGNSAHQKDQDPTPVNTPAGSKNTVRSLSLK